MHSTCVGILPSRVQVEEKLLLEGADKDVYQVNGAENSLALGLRLLETIPHPREASPVKLHRMLAKTLPAPHDESRLWPITA